MTLRATSITFGIVLVGKLAFMDDSVPLAVACGESAQKPFGSFKQRSPRDES